MPLPYASRNRIPPRIRGLAAGANPFTEPFAPECALAAQTGAFRRDVAPGSRGHRKCFGIIGHGCVSSRFLRRARSLWARLISFWILGSSASLVASYLLRRNAAFSIASIHVRAG